MPIILDNAGFGQQQLDKPVGYSEPESGVLMYAQALL
jgi:hypothetical protein